MWVVILALKFTSHLMSSKFPFLSLSAPYQLNEGSGTNNLPFPALLVHGGVYFYILISHLDAATTSPLLGLQDLECFHLPTSCYDLFSCHGSSRLSAVPGLTSQMVKCFWNLIGSQVLFHYIITDAHPLI